MTSPHARRMDTFRMNPFVDPDWRERLARKLDAPPLRPRLPLTLAQATATIGSIEPALAERLAAAGLPLVSAAAGCAIGASQSAANVDASFADIAQWLHANGVVSGWRNELLSVADGSGAVVGKIERAVVRPLGIATHAVHLIVRNARGDVWVQQRALDKSTDPGLWDTTMGGLSSAAESSAQTLERETWEEAGLRLPQFSDVRVFGHLTVRRPLAEGYMVEHIEMVQAVAAEGVAPMNQDGEVERFECLDPATLIERLHSDAFTLEAAMVLLRWLDKT